MIQGRPCLPQLRPDEAKQINIFLKKHKKTNVGNNAEKLEPLNILVQMEKDSTYVYDMNVKLPHSSTTLLLDIYAKEVKTGLHIY